LKAAEAELLQGLADGFSQADAVQVKHLEEVTRHDVKAVESFLRAQLADSSLADVVEYLHFGLTSEDVNNLMQALALREAREKVLLPAIDKTIEGLDAMARTHKATPMLARTHGQPAVTTMFGKEMAVFARRLKKLRKTLAHHRFEGKLNGATGNFNAMAAAEPQVDWPGFSERFVRGLNLEPVALTTQILPYDNWIEYFQTLQLLNSVLVGLCQDLWQYASMGYLKLRVKSAEAGSSTMPHKVNPIDFENAEGNLGISNALLEHYARKLPISRMQRDLSDSTVRRTFGSALGHALVAYRSLSRGLGLVEVDREAMRADLNAHWEVVAEGAQTILRTAGLSNPYDLLKELTRGRSLTQREYGRWVEDLHVDEAVKRRLRALSPVTYTGLAEEIVVRTISKDAMP
jgi:adenylosuccinate lyase